MDKKNIKDVIIFSGILFLCMVLGKGRVNASNDGWVIDVAAKPKEKFYMPALCNGMIGFAFSSENPLLLDRVSINNDYQKSHQSNFCLKDVTNEEWFPGIHFTNLESWINKSFRIL